MKCQPALLLPKLTMKAQDAMTPRDPEDRMIDESCRPERKDAGQDNR